MDKQKLEFYNNNTIVKIITYYPDKDGIVRSHISYYDLINQQYISNNSPLLNSIIQNNFKIECTEINDECALCPDNALVANNDLCLVSNSGWVIVSNAA